MLIADLISVALNVGWVGTASLTDERCSSSSSARDPDRRPKQETEREFLTALGRELIAKPDPNARDRDIVASFDAIVTKDK
jgi:hypothetical protein